MLFGLQEDGTSSPTLQKSAATVLARPRSGRHSQVLGRVGGPRRTLADLFSSRAPASLRCGPRSIPRPGVRRVARPSKYTRRRGPREFAEDRGRAAQVGGIFVAASRDGANFSEPRLLAPSAIRPDQRTTDHPADLRDDGSGLELLVLHDVRMPGNEAAEPYFCRYSVDRTRWNWTAPRRLSIATAPRRPSTALPPPIATAPRRLSNETASGRCAEGCADLVAVLAAASAAAGFLGVAVFAFWWRDREAPPTLARPLATSRKF